MHHLKNPTFISLSRLGDQIPGGFFIYRADDAQEIVYVNRAVLNIFGCEDEQQFRDLTGYTFRGMVHPDDFDAIQASIDEQIADANNNNLDCVEYRIIRRDCNRHGLSKGIARTRLRPVCVSGGGYGHRHFKRVSQQNI